MDPSEGEAGSSESANESAESRPDRLWDEYKLIQSKIDKIGEFQFKVKSWSVTVLGAALFGGAATSRFGTALSCALVVAVLFHLSERRQRSLSKRLGRRALAIEHALTDFPPSTDRSRWQATQRRIPAMRFVPGIAGAMSRERRRWEDRESTFRWLVIHSDDVFYFVQYALLATVIFSYLGSLAVKTWCFRSNRNIEYEISIGHYRIKIYKTHVERSDR
jgi:hypothetical protein